MLSAKRLIQKAVNPPAQNDLEHGGLKSTDLEFQISVHYGVPATASVLAFDPIQRLLAVGTLDGRIKVIRGDDAEGLLVSPKQLPYKFLEFIPNQGFLIGVSTDNDIQVWNLESRCIACSLGWKSSITAFSVVNRTHLMYIGDENGSITVVKYDAESSQLLLLPYQLPAKPLYELAGSLSANPQPVVGVLTQPSASESRLLIAYQHGLLILWDASEAQIVFVGGEKDLQLKNSIVSSQGDEASNNSVSEEASCSLEGKEISALCWASSDGSILAVGYVDGDILFWKTPTTASSSSKDNFSSSDIVKLQLSSSERRLPVIVLLWSSTSKSSDSSNGGQLFIYGGVETGSDEVLTIVTLEWSSSKAETLKCAGRMDLTLTGSFADMIVLPNGGSSARDNQHKAALTVLTSPGQLHRFDGASLSSLLSHQDRKATVISLEFPAIVPTVGPPMTAARFIALPMHENSLKLSSEVGLAKKRSTNSVAASPKEMSIGTLSHSTESIGVERVCIAGYQDGSVRMWNATWPVLSLICLVEGKMQGVEHVAFGAPVTSLDFSLDTLLLAVGTEHGLVRVYNLNGSSNEASFWFVTESTREIKSSPQGKGAQCKAIFTLVHSPVEALQFSSSGAKLAVGFECGRAAILNSSSFSVLFLTASTSSSPLISVIWMDNSSATNPLRSSKNSESSPAKINPAEEVLLVLTKDSGINVLDCGSGKMIRSHPWHPKKKSTAISLSIIKGSKPLSGSTNGRPKQEPTENEASTTDPAGFSSDDSKQQSSTESLLLLSCEKSLRLYSTKSVIQGNKKAMIKVKHPHPCVWTATFKKDGKEVVGVVLLFTTGVIEFRSFPGLELVKESSLLSILRWNFKEKMEKIMSCDSGHIALANGSEMAFVSLFSGENCFRIPQSLPSLHDKVLAAAADAAFRLSFNRNKKQDTTKPGILGCLAKSFKGCKPDHNLDASQMCYTDNFSRLDGLFAKPPTLPDSSSLKSPPQPESHSPSLPPPPIKSEKSEELSIDDIVIDDLPPPLPQPTTTTSKQPKKEKREREQLLGTDDEIKPRLRTPQEIIATYRKAGGASSAASHARDKLMERQAKLERISRRTADLKNEAEDFASLANELVNLMEKRKKWWQI